LADIDLEVTPGIVFGYRGLWMPAVAALVVLAAWAVFDRRDIAAH